MKKFNYEISFLAESSEQAWEKLKQFREKQSPIYFSASLKGEEEYRPIGLSEILKRIFKLSLASSSRQAASRTSIKKSNRKNTKIKQ